MTSRKPRYLTKTVRFDGEEHTLFSIDGATWSSRKEELSQIQDRYEDGRVTFEEIRSGVVQKKARKSGKSQSDSTEKTSSGRKSPSKSVASAAREDKGSSKLATRSKKRASSKPKSKVKSKAQSRTKTKVA
ncbi:hypothetical protein MRY87_03265 [bacterium]|nr:hypothetical protein [bacterium]